MSERKKVLVISYHFPPTGGAGVQRAVKFVQYIRKFGYEPVVLTVKNPSVPVEDKSLLNDIPDNLTILKSKTFEPPYEVKNKVLKGKGKKKSLSERFIRNLLVPDPQILWLPGLLKKAFSLRRHPPDILFVTAPPFSSLVAGVIIKFILKKPLVSDFRDEWVGLLAGSSWNSVGRTNLIRFSIEKILQNFVIKHSDAVVAASPGYISAFEKRYKNLSNNKFKCITNGYDPTDIEASLPEKFNSIFAEGKFNIVYMGTVWRATSLKYFIDGVLRMKSKNLINLIIIGRVTPEEDDYLASCIELDIIKLDYIPHNEAIGIARHADALLVTMAPLKSSERWIPGKIFEYMAIRKHIISIIPESSASVILKQYSGSIIINPEDREKITDRCQELIAEWRSNGLGEINDDIGIHTRETKTKTLCSLFNSVLDSLKYRGTDNSDNLSKSMQILK